MGIAAVGVTAMTAASLSQASPVNILAGWDLIHTNSGTQFLGQPFIGVPLGTVDINTVPGVQSPYPSGVQAYGNTDTVVYRAMNNGGTLTNAGDSLFTDIKMTALQLKSTTAFDLGFGSHVYFATLSANQPAPPSSPPSNLPPELSAVNTMKITYNGTSGGTFVSDLYFSIDLHRDSLSGIVDLSGDKQQSNFNASLLKNFVTLGIADWRIEPSQTSIYLLPDTHFHVFGVVTHDAGDSTHVVEEAFIPEPATLSLFAAGLGLLGFRRRKNVVKTI